MEILLLFCLIPWVVYFLNRDIVYVNYISYTWRAWMYVILAGKLRKNNARNCSDELFVAENI